MVDTSTIRVWRKSRCFEVLAKNHNWSVVINGNEIGGIAGGQQKDFIVPPGRYVMAAQRRWIRSRAVEFTVSPGEVILFECQTSSVHLTQCFMLIILGCL